MTVAPFDAPTGTAAACRRSSRNGGADGPAGSISFTAHGNATEQADRASAAAADIVRGKFTGSRRRVKAAKAHNVNSASQINYYLRKIETTPSLLLPLLAEKAALEKAA